MDFKIFGKDEVFPIGRVLGFSSIYEMDECIFGEMFLFRENKPEYMRKNRIKIPYYIARLIHFDMQSELNRYMNYAHFRDNIYPEIQKNDKSFINKKTLPWYSLSMYKLSIEFDEYKNYLRTVKTNTENIEVKEYLEHWFNQYNSKIEEIMIQ